MLQNQSFEKRAKHLFYAKILEAFLLNVGEDNWPIQD